MQNLAVKTPAPRHFPISVEVYHLMAERGAFHPDERLELIGGKIFDISPIGSLHARCVTFLTNALIRIVGSSSIVTTQNPILLDDESEPQPDVAIINFREDYYKNALPAAADVNLLIEVADTSVEFDRGIKFQRYALAGVPEAWLVDLINDRVEVHFAPKGSAYSLSKTYQRGEDAVSETIPELNLRVANILG